MAIGYYSGNEPLEIKKFLQKNGWEKAGLDAGDYQTPEFVIERKTHDDLIQSIGGKNKKERYKPQLAKMTATGKKIIYILEGDLKKAFQKWTGIGKTYDNTRKKRYIGMVSSLIAKYGATIVTTTTKRMTAELLLEISSKQAEELEYDMFDAVNSEIDGIGSDRMIKVIGVFSFKMGMPWHEAPDTFKLSFLERLHRDRGKKGITKIKIKGLGPRSIEKMIKHFQEKVK